MTKSCHKDPWLCVSWFLDRAPEVSFEGQDTADHKFEQYGGSVFGRGFQKVNICSTRRYEQCAMRRNSLYITRNLLIAHGRYAAFVSGSPGLNPLFNTQSRSKMTPKPKRFRRDGAKVRDQAVQEVRYCHTCGRIISKDCLSLPMSLSSSTKSGL